MSKYNVNMSDSLASDMYSDSPLHLACRIGDFKVVKTLLQADCSLVNRSNQDGFTPLMLAVQSCHIKCIRYLLNCGASTNRCSNNHMTGIQYAARSGNKQVLELMLQATSFTFIQEHTLKISNLIINSGSGVSNSLMSCIIQSGSPECMSVLLKSGLPKSILEAPYLKKENNFLLVFSPLAFLFSKFILNNLDCYILDEFLQLLLQHGITHLNEFSELIKWRLYIHSSEFISPLTCILDTVLSVEKCYHYLNILIENGITPDYPLQCFLQCSSQCAQDYNTIDFQELMKYLNFFYLPVIKAIEKDDTKLIELFMSNSAILEPFHLCNYLNIKIKVLSSYPINSGFCYTLRNYKESILFEINPKVANYLMNFRVVFNTYKNFTSCLGQEVPTLQELCRHTIRKSLRDLTLYDNINNFKKKINSLPLPESLKNYLHFKRR